MKQNIPTHHAEPPGRTREPIRRPEIRGIRIRRLERSEKALLDEVFTGMSIESRYRRFHSAVTVLTDSMSKMLLDVDDHQHVALVATVRGRAVGIARLILESSDEAEITVSVIDSWHRRGVGRALLDEVRRCAQELRVGRVHASVLPSNRAAIGLFFSVFPIHLTRHEREVIVLVGLLGERDWEITMEDVLGDLAS